MDHRLFQPFSDIPGDACFVRMDFFDRNRLGVLLQEDHADEEMQRAFGAGPVAYSYLEAGDGVPVAIWSFRFPEPIGLVEVNFDLTKTHPHNRDALLTGVVAPELRFYLRLAGQLADVVLFKLSTDAWALFQATLQRQAGAAYSREDYDQSLAALYEYPAEEIAAMGWQFLAPQKSRGPNLIVIPGGKSLH